MSQNLKLQPGSFFLLKELGEIPGFLNLNYCNTELIHVKMHSADQKNKEYTLVYIKKQTLDLSRNYSFIQTPQLIAV